jgi:serine/threonine protein kinase
LNTENIFFVDLDSIEKIVIADFGFAKQLKQGKNQIQIQIQEFTKSFLGTPVKILI